MSSQEVATILMRSLLDESFLNEVLSDPSVALADFDLTDDEREALVTGSSDLLRHVSGVDPVAFTWPNIYNFAWEMMDPVAQYDFEGSLRDRYDNNVHELNRTNELIVELRKLPTDELEARVKELLADWRR